MIKEQLLIPIHEVLSRLLRHPLLQDLDIEAAALYAVDFLHAVKSPLLYLSEEADIDIENHRGLLPCGVVSIVQVKDLVSGECLRSMTDSFMPVNKCIGNEELSFRTQGRVIITSIKNGKIRIAYKSIPVDLDGYPLLWDNATFLKALELYIKKEAFTILFDQGKIRADVMNKAETDYAWKVGLLQSEMSIPSVSEMESISRDWNTMIPRMRNFDNGFRSLGNREYIKRH